jgi:ABC transport system ATP-binding/permease protein
MRERIDKCENLVSQNAPSDSFVNPLSLLVNGFREEAALNVPVNFSFLNSLEQKQFNHAIAERARTSLDSLKEYYIDEYNHANEKKETMMSRMTASPDGLAKFKDAKDTYENESLEEVVKCSNQTDRLVVTQKKIIQRFEPVFHINKEESFFKAPLFSSVKNFAGRQWSTLSANIVFIWLMTLFLFIALEFNWLRKVISKLSRS